MLILISKTLQVDKMAVQTICSKDIYHGLPVFPDDVEGLTAIVTGANGISGTYMVGHTPNSIFTVNLTDRQLRVLCESPKRWKKIYAVCRRPPHGEWPSQVEHVSMDLLQSPEKIAEQMHERGMKADHAFFFAYIQPKPKEGGSIWSAVDELVKVNSMYSAQI